MKLTPNERGDLTDTLWLGVNPKKGLDAACEGEIARRIQHIDSDEVDAFPGRP